MNEQTFYICNAIFIASYWIMFWMIYPKTNKKMEDNLRKNKVMELRIENILWKSFIWNFFGGTIIFILIGNFFLWLMGVIYNFLF